MAGVRREAGERSGNLPHWRTLSALFRLEGGDFIMAAYRAILGREADPAGLNGYAARSERLIGRIGIAVSLLLSPERLLLPAPIRRVMALCRHMRHGRREKP